jgi:hypothetical protein
LSQSSYGKLYSNPPTLTFLSYSAGISEKIAE